MYSEVFFFFLDLTAKSHNAPHFPHSVFMEVCHNKIWHETHIVEWKIWCPAMVPHAKKALTMHNNKCVHLTDTALRSTAFFKIIQHYKNTYFYIFCYILFAKS